MENRSELGHKGSTYMAVSNRRYDCYVSYKKYFSFPFSTTSYHISVFRDIGINQSLSGDFCMATCIMFESSSFRSQFIIHYFTYLYSPIGAELCQIFYWSVVN
jgi:hypothetical protein